MSALNSSLLLGQEGGGGYAISRSLRFNSSDSGYCSRVPSTAGNRKTFTVACWVKKVKNESILPLYNARQSSSDFTNLWFDSGDGLFIQSRSGGSNALYAYTSAVFRDPSAWYHVVIAVDTTQATAANGLKVYVNGVQQTLTIPTYSQNSDTWVNSTQQQRIGYLINQNSSTYYLDSYLADCFLIDGQALDPTSFGEFDANGIWQPKAYTGSYGTNGFHLDFADNSTTAALGTDTSGNGNTWTVNNISVTAGAGNDSLVDVPANGSETDTGVGGEVRGNYCTWNPLDVKTTIALSNGNLDLVGSSDGRTRGTISMPTGKWYWEITATAVPVSNSNHVCIWANNVALSNDTYRVVYRSDGAYVVGGTLTTGWASWTTNDVIGVTFDADTRETKFYKNNTLQGAATAPALPSGSAYTPAVILADTNSSQTANFGQRPFAYTAPSGFKALCTANLPAPVVTKPSTVMDVKLWTGNGSSQTITTDFSPDFVWIKRRDAGANYHILTDTVRGSNKQLFSNDTIAEESRTDRITAFNSDGFTLGSYVDVNNSTYTYAGWCWDAGSSTVTNTQGSISSQVRANASAGFSIVTYTGNGSAGATVGHGLGVTPAFVIAKSRNNSSEWMCYHQSLGNAQSIILNTTAAAGGSSGWNSTSPSSTVITLGVSGAGNFSGYTHVIYAFAPVAGYSSFGSYTGNGSADGPFVYTGFRPRYAIFKSTTTATGWFIWDSARNSINVMTKYLAAHNSDAEGTYTGVDFLSNGFKFRSSSGNDGFNQSGQTYIYAAFAESPFQYARAR